MKSILKKTLGVLILITFLPLVSITFEAILIEKPNYLEAALNGLTMTGIIVVASIIGWQVGKVISWCFKK